MNGNSCPLLNKKERQSIRRFVKDKSKELKVDVYNGKCTVLEALGCLIDSAEIQLQVYLQRYFSTTEGQSFREELQKLEEGSQEDYDNKMFEQLYDIVRQSLKSTPSRNSKGERIYDNPKFNDEIALPKCICKQINDTIETIKSRFPVNKTTGNLSVSQFNDLRQIINEAVAQQGYLGKTLLEKMITFINCGGYYKVIYRVAIPIEDQEFDDKFKLILGTLNEDASDDEKKKYNQDKQNYHQMALALQTIAEYNQRQKETVVFDWVNHEYNVITGRDAFGNQIKQRVSFSASSLANPYRRARVSTESQGKEDDKQVQFKLGNAFDNIARDLFMHLNPYIGYGGQNHSLLKGLEQQLITIVKDKDNNNTFTVDRNAYFKLLGFIENRIKEIIKKKKGEENDYIKDVNNLSTDLKKKVDERSKALQNYELKQKELEESAGQDEAILEGLRKELAKAKSELDDAEKALSTAQNNISTFHAEHGAPNDWVNVFAYVDEKSTNTGKALLYQEQVFNTARSILDMMIGIKKKMFDITGDPTCVFLSGTVDEKGNVDDLPACAGIVYDNPNDIRGRYIGGIMDMWVIDSEGTPHIFDFKTSMYKSGVYNLKYVEKERKDGKIYFDLDLKDEGTVDYLQKLEKSYVNTDSPESTRRRYTTQLTHYYNILSSDPTVFALMEHVGENGEIHSTTLNIVKTNICRWGQFDERIMKDDGTDGPKTENRKGTHSVVYRHIEVPYRNSEGQFETRPYLYLVEYDENVDFSTDSKGIPPGFITDSDKKDRKEKSGRYFYGFEVNPTDREKYGYEPIDQSSEPTFRSGSPKSDATDEEIEAYFRNQRIKSANRFIGDLEKVSNRIREMVDITTVGSGNEFSAAKDYLRKLMITDEFSIAMGNVIANEFSRNLDLIEKFIDALDEIDLDKLDEFYKGDNENENKNEEENKDKNQEFLLTNKALISFLKNNSHKIWLLAEEDTDIFAQIGRIFKTEHEVKNLLYQIRTREQLIKGGAGSRRYFGNTVRKNIFDKVREDLFTKFNNIVSDVNRKTDAIKSYIDSNFGFKNTEDNEAIAEGITEASINGKVGSIFEGDAIERFLNIFKPVDTDGRDDDHCVFRYFKSLSLRDIAKNEGISIKRSVNKITVKKNEGGSTYLGSEVDEDSDEDDDNEILSMLESSEDTDSAETIEQIVERWGTGNDEKNFRESISVIVKKALSRIPAVVSKAEAYRNPFFYFIRDMKTCDAGKLTDTLIRHLSKCGDLPSMRKKIEELGTTGTLAESTKEALLDFLDPRRPKYDEVFASRFFNAFSKYPNVYTSVVTQLDENTGHVSSYVQVINSSSGSRDMFREISRNSTSILRFLRAFSSLDANEIDAIEYGDAEGFFKENPKDAEIVDKIIDACDFYLNYVTIDENGNIIVNQDAIDELIATKKDPNADPHEQWLADKTFTAFSLINQAMRNLLNRGKQPAEFLLKYIELKNNGELKEKDSIGYKELARIYKESIDSFKQDVISPVINYKNTVALNKITGRRVTKASLFRVKNINDSLSTITEILDKIDTEYFTTEEQSRQKFVDDIIDMMKKSSVYSILKKVGVNVTKATYDRTIEESRFAEDIRKSKAYIILNSIKSLITYMRDGNNINDELFYELNNFRYDNVFEKNAEISDELKKKVNVVKAMYWNICEALSDSFESVIQSGAYVDGKMRYTYINRSYMTQFIQKLSGSDPLETREEFIARNFIKPQFFPQSEIDRFKASTESLKSRLQTIAASSYNAIIRDLILNPELSIDHSQCVSYNGKDYKSMSPLEYASALICNFYGCNDEFQDSSFNKQNPETRPMRNYRISIYSNKPSLELVKFRAFSVDEVKNESKNVLDQEINRIRIALSRICRNVSIDSKENVTFTRNEVECFDIDWEKLYQSDKDLFNDILILFEVPNQEYYNLSEKEQAEALKQLKQRRDDFIKALSKNGSLATALLSRLKKIIKLSSKGSSKSAAAFNALEFLNDLLKKVDLSDSNASTDDDKHLAKYIVGNVFSIFLDDNVGSLYDRFESYMKEKYRAQLEDYKSRGLFNPSITVIKDQQTVVFSFPCLGGNVKSLSLKYEVENGAYKVYFDPKSDDNKELQENAFIVKLLNIQFKSLSKQERNTGLITLEDLIDYSYSNRVIKSVRDSILDRLLDWEINDSNYTEDVDGNGNEVPNHKDSIYAETNPSSSPFGLDFTKLKEYFYSDWLITYNMTNLTTSDLAFYKNHVEFQKRQAQMHSSSSKLDKFATWKGERVSDGKIRYLIIEDFAGKEFSSKVYSAIKQTFDEEFNRMKLQFFEDHGAITNGKPDENMLNEADKGEWEAIERTYLAEVDTILNKFKNKIDLTDGQSYTSPTGYRKKMVSVGKWSEEHEKAFLAATSRNEKTIRDYFKTLEGIKVLCQPIKPFAYGQLDETDINVPFQVKNSEYMLFVAGIIADRSDDKNILRIIHDLMERSHYERDENGEIDWSRRRTDGIDTIAFKSCVKVGASSVLNVTPITVIKNGEPVLETVDETIARLEKQIYSGDPNHRYLSSIKELDMDNYGIQQEVPAHYADHYQQMASQARILAESDAPKTYHRFANGKWVEINSENSTSDDGEKIGALDMYEALIAKKIQKAIRKFKQEFDMNKINTPEGKIKFKAKISKVLIDTIGTNEKFVSDLIEAVSLDNEGNFCRNLNDEAISSRVQELINSYIRKRINKTEMPGGPVVQVSGCGVSKSLHIRWRGKDGNVMLTEEEFNDRGGITVKEFVDPDGKTIEEKKYNTFKEYEKAMKESVAYLEAYAPVPSEDIARLLTYNGRLLSPDEAAAKGLITQEAADKISKIIGVRIPTEDKYSMLPIKIVGWLSSYYSGEGVMLPDEITVLTGSDFDIDKLFVTRYATTFGKVTSAEAAKMINSFIKNGLNLKGTFIEDMYNDYMQNLDRYAKLNIKGSDYTSIAYTNIISIFLKNAKDCEFPSPDLWKETVKIYKGKLNGYTLQPKKKNCLDRLVGLFGPGILDREFNDVMKLLLFYSAASTVSDNNNRFLNHDIPRKGKGRIEALSSIRVNQLGKNLSSEAYEKEEPFDKSLFYTAMQYRFILFNNIIINEKHDVRKEIINEGVPKDKLDMELGRLEDDQIDNYIFDYQWMFLTDRSTAAKMFNPGSFDPQDKIAKIVTIRRGCDPVSIVNFINEIRSTETRKGRSKVLLTENPSGEELYNALLELDLDELDDLLSSSETDDHNILFVGSQIYFFEQNMAAAKLIGTIANHNISHAILQRQNIRYHSVDDFIISLGSHVVKNGKDGKKDSYEGTKLDGLKDCRGIYISKNIAGFLAASVDAAKKPVLNYLNINGLTISPLMCLIRLGFDVNTASMFIAQDAIVELIRRFNQENANGHISLSKSITNYIRELHEKYIGADVSVDNIISKSKNQNNGNISTETLFANIGRKYGENNNGTIDAEKAKYDIVILSIFQKLVTISTDVKNMTEQCRFNSMMYAVGPRINDTRSRRNDIERFNRRYALTLQKQGADNASYDSVNFYINLNSEGRDDRIISNSRLLSAYYYDLYGDRKTDKDGRVVVTKGLEREIMEALGFIEYNPIYDRIIKRLSGIAKYGLDDYELNRIKGEFVYYLISKGKEGETKDKDINPGFNLSTSEIAELLEHYPDTWYETVRDVNAGYYGKNEEQKALLKYAINTINSFFTVEERNEFHPNYSCLDLISASLRPEAIEEFKNAINILISIPDGIGIANKLFRYTMLRSGGHFNPRTAYHLFTTEFVRSLRSYNYALSHLDDLAEEKDILKFCDMYVRNHNGKNDNKIIRSVYVGLKSAYAELRRAGFDEDGTLVLEFEHITSGNVYPTMLPIATNYLLDSDGQDYSIYSVEEGVMANSNAQNAHNSTVPYISYKGKLYKLLKVSQLGGNVSVRYKQLSSLGKPGLFVEYDASIPDDQFLKSVYQSRTGVTMNYSNYMAYALYDLNMEKEYDSILSQSKRFIMETGDASSPEKDVSFVFYDMIKKLIGVSSPQQILSMAQQFELSINEKDEETGEYKNKEYREHVLEKEDEIEDEIKKTDPFLLTLIADQAKRVQDDENIC